MSKKTERLLVFVIFLFCLSLRLAFITQKNLWFDEIFSWHLTEGTFIDIIKGTSVDIHPPFYYFALKIWEILFGDSVFSMRLLSALLTSSAVFFIYPISKKLLGTVDSFLVLLLYSVSPLNLFYSQEVRMTSLNLLLNACSIYFFIKVLEINTEWKGYFKKVHTYLFILFSVLSLYTHYFSFFVLIAQAIFLIFVYGKQFKKYFPYIIIFPVILLSYVFWFPIILNQVAGGQPWRRGQNIYEVLEQVFIFLKYLSIGAYSSYLANGLLTFIGSIIVILTLIILIGLFINISKGRIVESDKSQINYLLMILLIAFIPTIAAILISFKQWIELFRYLSFIVPYILMSGFIGLKYFNNKLRFGLMIVFLCLNLFGDYLYYHSDYKNNDYRQLLKRIETESKGKESVYVYPHYYAWGIDYYVKQGDFMIPLTENYGWEFDSLYGSLKRKNTKKFWLVLDYAFGDTSSYEEKVNILKADYFITLRQTYLTVPFHTVVYRFEKKTQKQ